MSYCRYVIVSVNKERLIGHTADMMMEAVRTSETSVYLHETAWR
jgi:hypothetical protein